MDHLQAGHEALQAPIGRTQPPPLKPTQTFDADDDIPQFIAEMKRVGRSMPQRRDEPARVPRQTLPVPTTRNRETTGTRFGNLVSSLATQLLCLARAYVPCHGNGITWAPPSWRGFVCGATGGIVLGSGAIVLYAMAGNTAPTPPHDSKRWLFAGAARMTSISADPRQAAVTTPRNPSATPPSQPRPQHRLGTKTSVQPRVLNGQRPTSDAMLPSPRIEKAANTASTPTATGTGAAWRRTLDVGKATTTARSHSPGLIEPTHVTTASRPGSSDPHAGTRSGGDRSSAFSPSPDTIAYRSGLTTTRDTLSPRRYRSRRTRTVTTNAPSGGILSAWFKSPESPDLVGDDATKKSSWFRPLPRWANKALKMN